MKVIFLQHEESLGPGKLGEYLVRRHRAVATVLRTDEIHERHVRLEDVDLIVSLGSPVSVYSDVDWVVHERQILSTAIAIGRPILGICFGAQMIAALAGGSMTPTGTKYVGWLENDVVSDPVWRGPWFRFHKAQCELAPSAEIMARSHGTIQAFQYRNTIGLQFHPEMDVSIVENLVPTMRSYFDLTTAEIEPLIKETYARVDAISVSRELLFDEILDRYKR